MNNEYGRCGIIEGILIDPLSLLISKIIKKKENCLGVYYLVNNYYQFFLFNVYDLSPICWLKMGGKLDSILNSKYVFKLKFYPLSEYWEIFPTLFLEKLNIHPSYDKFNSFKSLLLNEKIYNSYNFIDDIILTLFNKYYIDLKEPIIYINNNINNDIINEDIKKELSKLLIVFIDLFINNLDFQYKILSYENNEIIDFKNYLKKDSNLINYISNSISKGFININSINNLINNIKEERINLGNNELIKLIELDKNKNNIKIINNILEPLNNNIQVDPIFNFKCYLENIIENLNKEIIIDLKELIEYFNKLSNLKIELPKYNKTKTKKITLIIPNNTLNTNDIIVTSDNLKILNDQELTDILIYIDSLRDSNGNTNNKFNSIENKIIQELGIRNRDKI